MAISKAVLFLKPRSLAIVHEQLQTARIFTRKLTSACPWQ